MKTSGLYGLVLAGGRSSRMGKDKGLIQYRNKPHREYLFDLLGKFCDNVFTSCRSEQEIGSSLNPIYDKFDFESPLNGIISAMEQHPEKSWLTVAVDMPLVDENVLQFLITNRNNARVATCFYDSDGKLPEPLLTIWESSALKLLKDYTLNGGVSPRGFLVGHDCKKLTSPDPRIHININTPEDFAKVKNQRR